MATASRITSIPTMTAMVLAMPLNSPLVPILKTLHPKVVLYEEGIGLEEEMGRSNYSTYALGSWSRQECSGFISEITALSPEKLSPINGSEDIASIFFTSGTTAEPKGILCTFQHLEKNVAAVLCVGSSRHCHLRRPAALLPRPMRSLRMTSATSISPSPTTRTTASRGSKRVHAPTMRAVRAGLDPTHSQQQFCARRSHRAQKPVFD